MLLSCCVLDSHLLSSRNQGLLGIGAAWRQTERSWHQVLFDEHRVPTVRVNHLRDLTADDFVCFTGDLPVKAGARHAVFCVSTFGELKF